MTWEYSGYKISFMKIVNKSAALPLLAVCFFMSATSMLPLSASGNTKRTHSAPLVFPADSVEYRTSPDKHIGAKILIDPANTGPGMLSASHLTYLPGAHVPAHAHVYVSEMLYILKGHLTVKIDGKIISAGPDTAIYIPNKTVHEYMNDSADIVQFLQIYSPTGPEEEYRSWNPANVKISTNTPKNDKAEDKNVILQPMPIVPGSPGKPAIGELKVPESLLKQEEKSYQLQLEEKSHEKIEPSARRVLGSNETIRGLLLELRNKE